ncbi:MAG: hypothetical protein CL676_02455 [Bdellovibrionaceae bacterium]|nr:hypothetical protein [Pseudobdellovibrionaceae bacterium]|tara:strand:- start:2734 stop:3555 length:822 start_codon:yes stop_codon:yes gene_type:complete
MGQSFQDIFWKTLRPLSEDFKNKKVADVPAGKGQSSLKLKSLGAEVYPLDLVPDFFEAEGLECQFCDLNQQLPLDSNSMDVILSQEGIEHISDQNLAFKEFSRVLKKGGTLILSSPNGSSLKSRFSFLMGECEKSGKILPPNLFDSIWFNPGESSQVYFGHLFVPTVTKLRVLAEVNGLELKKVHFSHLKFSNLVLFVFLYPWMFLSQSLNYFKNVRKRPFLKSEYQKTFWLSVSPKVLLDGALVLEFQKVQEPEEAIRELNKRWSRWQKNQP